MVVTRKRSDSVQSNQDESSGAAGAEDSLGIRRSSRLQTRGSVSSPLPARQSTRTRKVPESPLPSDCESVQSVTKSSTRGRKPKVASFDSESEAESHLDIDGDKDEPATLPSKRKRTDSASSIISLDVEPSTRRPSSRNTPLKSSAIADVASLTRSTRRGARTRSESADEGDIVLATPRRAPRKSMKVSAEPNLGVVSEELKSKPVSHQVIIEEVVGETANKRKSKIKIVEDISCDVEQEEGSVKSITAKTDVSEACAPVTIISQDSDVDDFTLAIPDSPVASAPSTDVPVKLRVPLLGLEALSRAAVVIPRGKNVSGRFWREPKDRFKNNFKDKGLKSSKEQYEKLRIEKKRVKLIEQRFRDDRKQKIEELRKRQQLNGQRKEANERRGETVQVIRNTTKLKTLSKKQKRLIQKRDTTNMK